MQECPNCKRLLTDGSFIIYPICGSCHKKEVEELHIKIEKKCEEKIKNAKR